MKRAAYHGQNHLEGKKTHKFLEKIDYLDRDIMKESHDIQIRALPLVRTLRSLKKVVDSCFGGAVSDSFRADLKQFSEDYRAAEISVTPKAHIIMAHVETFIDLKADETGVLRGLGYFSEQAVEAVHADFGAFWKKYKVPLQHPDYLKQLFRAVIAYNAKHV